jgi:RNA-directed DNA polymerase
MRPLDASRFIYSLVGTMVSQPWTPVALRTALRASSVDRPIRVPRLAERILAAFPHNPGFNELVTFLRADAGLSRAIKRLRADVGLSRAIKRSARPSAPNAKRSALLPPKMEQPPVGLKDLRIPDLPTEAALADWFAMDSQHLRWRADLSGRNRRHRKSQLRTYRYRWIARRNGPPRLLEIPKAKLKEMQKQILAEILDRVPAHPAAHGFRAGRSIVTNAIVHCGKPSVLRFDLTDFFPSVSSARVFRIFRTIGYPTTVARLLMGLCTTTLPADVWESRPSAQDGSDFQARQRLITRHLPQGAPTSPALANLAAGRLDRRLRALATAVGADYTRYADDLTFSGGEEIARNRKRLATLVAVIADDEGFALNHRKTRLMRSGVRQHVTGVVVNVRPNIGRAEFDRLKAILTNCLRHGPASQNRDQLPDFRAHLAGKISHVSCVHPARGDKLRKLFRQIAWDPT